MLLASQMLTADSPPTGEEESAQAKPFLEEAYPDHLFDSDADVFLAYFSDGAVTHPEFSATRMPCAPSLVSLTA